MLLPLIGATFVLVAVGMFFHLGWRTSKLWRDLKEEVFFHFTLIFFAVSLLLLAFITILLVRPLPFTMNLSDLFFLGIFYDLFYLELSFIYLTLFPNTRRIVDKYLPFVIAGAMIMNAVAGTARAEIYHLTGTALHIIVISIGLYLIFQAYLNLKINENYFKGKERNWIAYIEKAILFAFVTFLVDGIGFLAWHYLATNNMVINEFAILFFTAMTVIFTTAGYLIMNKAGKKASGCDLLLILNTIS